jgi:hypothetical protein
LLQGVIGYWQLMKINISPTPVPVPSDHAPEAIVGEVLTKRFSDRDLIIRLCRMI